MLLLQKNLPAIVVVVYAKQIMALGREKKKNQNPLHSPHSFLPLIIIAKGDGLEIPWSVIFFCAIFSLLPFMPCICHSLSSNLSAGLHV